MSMSRSQLYGESIFTSFRSFAGYIPQLNQHVQRVLESVNDYYLNHRFKVSELDKYFGLSIKLKENLSRYPHHYFRVTIFENSHQGLLLKETSLSDLEMSLDIKEITLVSKNLSLTLAPSPFSENYTALKSGSYFQHFYAKREAIRNGFDDVLFYHKNNGALTEASTSNILFKQGKSFFTPNGHGFLKGIGLQIFNDFCLSEKIQFKESAISKRNLSDFDEAYLVNCVKLMTPIQNIGDINFNSNNQLKDDLMNFILKGGKR